MLIVKNPVIDVDNMLEAYEKKANILFPEQLKLFVLKYNGGETPRTSIETEGVSTDVQAFYGFGNINNSYDKVSCVEISGKEYLPVGKDSFGNQFLIELTEPNRLFFLNHEQENGLALVADSFNEFLGLCKSEKISEMSRKTPEEREQILIEKGKGSNITEGLRVMWKDEYEKFHDMVQEEVIL